MLTIKKLQDCTWNEAVEAWNRGFEGYYFDMTSNVDAYTTRMTLEDLSPRLSINGFVDGKPVGMVLSGTRMIDGKKVAWNGGTGVADEYRGHGYGKQLMEASLDVYREDGVDIAILEAMSQNDRAIALYEKLGYRVIDNIDMYVNNDAYAKGTFGLQGEPPFTARSCQAKETSLLPFHNGMAPWQAQWQAARLVGEGVIAYDAAGKAVGYAVFRRRLDEAGALANIALLQAVADPTHPQAEAILGFLLREVFGAPSLNVKRNTLFLSSKDERLTRLLREEGFTISASQVYMLREMEK